jgi:NAD(P)H-nitrite reductase large subunit
MKHVIIGNGPTGVVAAEALRSLDPHAQITLIGDEPEPPYSRMAIPYFLVGNIPDSGTYLRKTPDHFAKAGIELVRGRVARVDSAGHRIHLENGEDFGYDRLLIATGSRPVRPPVPGMDLPAVHTCWTLADARAIVEKAQAGTRVLQIGAGFIGCIILEALVARGVKLTVVEAGDRLVPRMMTPRAGTMIRRWVERNGITVHVNAKIASIAPQGDALLGRLESGETVDADLVICAAGIRPNVEFLAGSGIEIGRGIRVDDRMRTSMPDIYAAGDVTEAPGFHSGEPEVNAVQPNAADQARIAAINMAGGDTRSQGSLAFNVLDTLGLISTSFGQWWGTEGGQGVEQADEDHFQYLSLQFDDDVLIGATGIGHTQHAGVLRGLIQGRVRLGGWKDRLLADPSQYMAAYLACAQDQARRHEVEALRPR